MEAEHNFVPVKVRVAAGEAHLNCAWGSKNQIAVHGATLGQRGDLPGSNHSAPCVNLLYLNADMQEDIMRRLANEALGVFVSLQKNAESLSDQKALYSRQYRAILTACTQELQLAKDKTTDVMLEELESQHQDELLKSLYISELVWSISEILFVEQLPAGTLLVQLLAWARLHLGEWRSAAEEAMRSADEQRGVGSAIHWTAIFGCMLRGQVDEARKLLALLPHALSAPYAIMDELLRRMPQYGNMAGHTTNEFTMRWRHWQQECRRHLNDGEFASDENLTTLCRVLSGDDSVFVELRDICETWYGMLVSRLLFQNPVVRLHDLPQHVQFCINQYGGPDCFDVHDTILLAAFELDILEVVKLCTERFTNTWFVAHFVDLMQHGGALNAKVPSFGCSLRDHLVLDYGASLMQHDSLWNVGVIYLDYCGESGRNFQMELLPRVTCTCEKKAYKLITACRQRGLNDQASSICKVMAVQAAARGQLSSALVWCQDGKDSAFATIVAEKFLDQYQASGAFDPNLDVLESLSSLVLLSKRVLFLAKYYEFHTLHEQAMFKDAGALLLSLLTSNVTPRRYRSMLLTDALPLLESSDGVFTTSQTYDLMDCLEDHLTALRKTKQPLQGDDASERELDRLGALKLGLARNLARAIVDEARSTVS